MCAFLAMICWVSFHLRHGDSKPKRGEMVLACPSQAAVVAVLSMHYLPPWLPFSILPLLLFPMLHWDESSTCMYTTPGRERERERERERDSCLAMPSLSSMVWCYVLASQSFYVSELYTVESLLSKNNRTFKVSFNAFFWMKDFTITLRILVNSIVLTHHPFVVMSSSPPAPQIPLNHHQNI